MTFDVAQIDEVLATTRAVRRRLDLDRPVDNQVLLDCIDLAEQAPTGGNLGSRRWVIVREQAGKDELGQLYRETALGFMSGAAERLRGTGDRNEKVMASAAFLAEHLAEVPAIVIPTIIGRYDGSGRPGLFDSVIQAAWSFCLALRARDLGTTWVTAALADTARVKSILNIPDDLTEVVLFPVAYTKGTDFRRAPRHPARSITYFDRFGSTAERGPSDQIVFDDGPSNLRLTGELADGWIGTSFLPESADVFLDPIREGAIAAGRTLDDLDLTVAVGVEFTDDVEAAGRRHAEGYAFTIGAMGSAATNFYNNAFARQGFGDDVRAVQRLWLDGDKEAARQRVPAALGLGTNLIGTDELIRDRLRLYRDAGITTLRAGLQPAPLEQQLADLDRLLMLVHEVNSEA